MIIRDAKKDDQVADLILSAADELFVDFKVDCKETCAQDLFSNEKSKFSYLNSKVIEDNGKIIALMVSYPASMEHTLSVKQEELFEELYGRRIPFVDFESIKDTTYIDTIAVDEDYQNQGLATKLIDTINDDISLMVEVNNNAMYFYLKYGFVVNTTISLYNHQYNKMFFDNPKKDS